MSKRAVLPDKRKLRNLKQYKDLTDEEFEEVYSEEIVASISQAEQDLEDRIEEKLTALAEDYDMSDMKINDRLQLRAMAQAEIQLEDLEQAVYMIRQDITKDNVIVIEKLNNVMAKLRSDISSISDDLQLTRHIRKQSKEANVIRHLEDLKAKAMKFYKERMLYIFCPECKMLLATTWLMYPEMNNKLKLSCDHCGHAWTQDLKGLYKRGNKNLDDVLLP
jgi:hypothetical protein